VHMSILISREEVGCSVVLQCVNDFVLQVSGASICERPFTMEDLRVLAVCVACCSVCCSVCCSESMRVCCSVCCSVVLQCVLQ